ncbi:MAG: TonB-dependent receptor [Desulfobacterales bacterium]|nr:TonB-dependent receptor [Desulfobacterales bacterium]
MAKVCFFAVLGTALLSGAVAANSYAQAEPKETPVIQLNEISVTASRTEKEIVNEPASVTIVSRTDLDASPFERVEDVLRSVVGVDVNSHYGFQTGGIKGRVHLRGATSGITQRTLYLIDGVPQNDNANNSIGWIAYSQIPKDAIERIEIVRGPASALYGSEGLGGVINIITKKPVEKRETSVTLKYGSGETSSQEIFHSQKINRFGIMVNGQKEESDGFYMQDPVTADANKKWRDANRIYSKLTFDLDERSDLAFSFLRYEHEMSKGRPYFYGEKEDFRYWLNYTRRGETTNWRGLLYASDDEKDAYIDESSGALKYKAINRIENFQPFTWGAELQSSFVLSSFGEMTLGLAYKSVHFETEYTYLTTIREYRAEGDQEFTSPFVDYEIPLFGEKLILNVGFRYDYANSTNGKERDTGATKGYGPYDNTYPDKTWEEFSPKGGIVYRPDKKTALRASVGKGFRVPTLFELYKTHTRSGKVTIANPDLEPEKILSYDVGAERLFLDTLWGRVGFYQSFAEDLIAAEDHPTNANWNTRENLEEVEIQGMELEFKWLPVENWTIFSNYTYNKTEIVEDPQTPANEGNVVSGYPEHKAKAGFSYNNPHLFDANLIFNYVGKRFQDTENTIELDAYNTVDVSIGKTVPSPAKGIERLRLSLDIENLFDREYLFSVDDNGPDSTAPGIVFMGTMKLWF